MANRVVLDVANGLKVSKPGFNVLTASGLNIQFDSAWPQTKFWSRNQVYLPQKTDGPHTISFGKTFARRPMVFAIMDDRQVLNVGLKQWLVTTIPGFGIRRTPHGALVVNNNHMLVWSPYAALTMKYVIWDLDL